jgi:ubiquinone biosynthesis protein COQ9
LRDGYRTVDAIWRVAGDQATDFNFYTKRGLLAAVLASTTLFWLDDASEGHAETWGFLDRRIAGIMKIPKAQARVSEFVDRLTKPLAGLGAR